jgi:hypothetical protein
VTREEITALAREAGFIEMGGQHGALRRFALLVQAREREACALVAERSTSRQRVLRGMLNSEEPQPCPIAAAIRARSDK